MHSAHIDAGITSEKWEEGNSAKENGKWEGENTHHHGRTQ